MTALVFQYCFSVSIQTLFSLCKQVSTLEFIRKTDIGLCGKVSSFLVAFHSGLPSSKGDKSWFLFDRASSIFFLLALQPPLGVVFYSPLVGFSLLAYEVS